MEAPKNSPWSAFLPPGIAVALRQAMTPEFKAYQQQVVANCKALSTALMELGYDIVTGEDRSWLWDRADPCAWPRVRARPRGQHLYRHDRQCSAIAIPQDMHKIILKQPPFCPQNQGQALVQSQGFFAEVSYSSSVYLYPTSPPPNPSLCRGLRQPPDSPGPAQQRHGWWPG